MGITGLLPQLKSIMKPIHIKDIKGCVVAIDTYSWLHKGALSCSVQLCKGLPTSRHIDYCMHRVNLLRHYGVKPILVFDGDLLPMKSEQENKRARSRKENLARAIEHESSGNSAAAYECYQKAVDISPAIAYELIQVLKREDICYIVAPYEADAQMTFLATTKQVDAVITEDSDLIAFGCPRIIYKMDKFGQGVEFQISRLQQNKDLPFTGFTDNMVLQMCILSGCDYLASLPGLGLKKAHALISKFKTFEKVIKHLKYSSVVVPPLYEESFKKAIWTFRHQRVYDPKKEDIVHLSDMLDCADGDLDFLGPFMPQHVAKAIAEGKLDPISKLPFQTDFVRLSPASETSYQLKDYRPGRDKKKLDLPANKNVLSNYFCFASLEAKRNFRAPRASPKNPDSTKESSPTGRLQVSEDGAAFRKNHMSESLVDIVAPSDTMSPHDIMVVKCPRKVVTDSDSSLNGSRRSNLLKQSEHSIHKPCSTLQRERCQEQCLDTVPGNINVQGQDVSVKGSYMQVKPADENGPQCQSSRATLRSSYFLDKRDGDASEGKCKKIIVRSSYFKKKSSNSRDTKDGMIVNGASSDNDMSEKPLPEATSCKISHTKNVAMKRKASPDCTNSVDVDFKHSRTDASAEATNGVINSCGAIPNADNKSTDNMREEENFGCRISHLGQYSDIAGKSVDDYASKLSSFKYNSGSRASGLRAPLKDIKNICPTRSPAVIDISNFSYVSKDTGNAVRAPRRR